MNTPHSPQCPAACDPQDSGSGFFPAPITGGSVVGTRTQSEEDPVRAQHRGGHSGTLQLLSCVSWNGFSHPGR